MSGSASTEDGYSEGFFPAGILHAAVSKGTAGAWDSTTESSAGCWNHFDARTACSIIACNVGVLDADSFDHSTAHVQDLSSRDVTLVHQDAELDAQ